MSGITKAYARALFAICLAISSRCPASSIGDDYQKFLKAVEDSASDDSLQRSQRISKIYAALFPGVSDARLRQLSVADVEKLFDAAKVAELYSKGSAALNQMQAYYAALERTGTPSVSKQNDLYGALIDQRRFQDATNFAQRNHLKFEVIPRSPPAPARDAAPFSYLQLRGERLVFRQFHPSGSSVIVIASPLCPFTLRAAMAIELDQPVQKALAKHSIWIIPEERDLHIAALRKWNAQHPSMSMSLVYHRRDWPLITWWETPVFYFILDGKLKRAVIGWPGQKQLQQLKAGLSELHLLSKRDSSAPATRP